MRAIIMVVFIFFCSTANAMTYQEVGQNQHTQTKQHNKGDIEQFEGAMHGFRTIVKCPNSDQGYPQTIGKNTNNKRKQDEKQFSPK